jgi:hypothetical protein
MPTRRLGSVGGASPSSASDRAVEPILAAQPQVLAKPVSDFFLKNVIFHLSIDNFYFLSHSNTIFQKYNI